MDGSVPWTGGSPKDDGPVMILRGKWIGGTSAQQKLSSAASRALKARLRKVCRLLPRAALRAEENVEYVHRLRVAARRALAAVKVLKDLLPARQGRWLRKKLKRIRRAAGEARELDVLIASLKANGAYPDGENERRVVDHLIAIREAAQSPLRELHARLSDRFQREARDMVRQVAWRRQDSSEPTFSETARVRLRPLIKKFFTAAQSPLNAPEDLHRLRIAGKRLRYAMEVFGGALPKSFRTRLYPELTEVLDRLGEINDHTVARRRFETWSQTAASTAMAEHLRQLSRAEDEQLQLQVHRFLGRWTPETVRRLHQRFIKQLRVV
jgi:CHAD domain-containing protein